LIEKAPVELLVPEDSLRVDAIEGMVAYIALGCEASRRKTRAHHTYFVKLAAKKNRN
jgi:hypothetical protein